MRKPGRGEGVVTRFVGSRGKAGRGPRPPAAGSRSDRDPSTLPSAPHAEAPQHRKGVRGSDDTLEVS